MLKFRIWIPLASRLAAKGEYIISMDGYIGQEDYAYEGIRWLKKSKYDVEEGLIISRFTGVVNEDGVEIYEGDILANPYNDCVSLVDFNDENYGGVLGWNLLHYGQLLRDGDEFVFVEANMVEWEDSNKTYYQSDRFYYGSSPHERNTVVGNIFEGIK